MNINDDFMDAINSPDLDLAIARLEDAETPEQLVVQVLRERFHDPIHREHG